MEFEVIKVKSKMQAVADFLTKDMFPITWMIACVIINWYHFSNLALIAIYTALAVFDATVGNKSFAAYTRKNIFLAAITKRRFSAIAFIATIVIAYLHLDILGIVATYGTALALTIALKYEHREVYHVTEK